MNRRNDSQWLLYAQKEDIEARAFREVAVLIVKVLLALLLGCALIPVVMP